jgi:D-tyrosyl-tRNA(Tyr) deacylase
VKAVLQRVQRAAVVVDGKQVSSIASGLAVLLGVERGDGEPQALELAKKCVELRVFEDDAGKMNLCLADVKGEMLVVSQFTLCADASRGRRPSFAKAAEPGIAEKLYKRFMDEVAGRGIPVSGGVFGARMDVELVNRGPVTLVLESSR